MNLPPLIQQLIDAGPTIPVYYTFDGTHAVETVPGVVPPADECVRVELWVESGNNYVYTERKDSSYLWTNPRMGEHPEEYVTTLEDVAKNISPGARMCDVHPEIRKIWMA